MEVVLKVAVTELFVVIVNVQGLVVQFVASPVPPEKPPKSELASSVAVRVTDVPLAKEAAHVAPQSIPVVLEVMVPEPLPDLVTVRGKVPGGAVTNVAETSFAESMVTVHVPAPVQAPLQPTKVEPDAIVAVRITDVPEAKEVLQVAAQVIPTGDEVTVPLPVPAVVTVRVVEDGAEVEISLITPVAIAAVCRMFPTAVSIVVPTDTEVVAESIAA